MKMLEIITPEKNDKELRLYSRKLEVEEIRTPQIQEFIDDMIFTAKNTKLPSGWVSAGLAAIQVNNPIQIFIAADLNRDVFNVYINPEIEYLGNAKDIHIEACLSIPDTVGKVERFKRIRIRYFDRNGIPQVSKEGGFNARIIQHEYDHLFGILFTDKLV